MTRPSIALRPGRSELAARNERPPLPRRCELKYRKFGVPVNAAQKVDAVAVERISRMLDFKLRDGFRFDFAHSSAAQLRMRAIRALGAARTRSTTAVIAHSGVCMHFLELAQST